MVHDESVLEAVRGAVRDNPTDLEAQKAAAKEAVRAMPDFGAFVEALVDGEVERLVYACRGADNVQRKKAAGLYGGPAKVVFGPAVAELYQSLYCYAIAGRSLGDIAGGELADVANRERMVSRGHEFNARLLDRLAQLVPADKTVRQAVSEKKLQAVFKQCRGEDDPPLAMAGC